MSRVEKMEKPPFDSTTIIIDKNSNNEDLISWKSMTFREKWSFFRTNVTVEPMVALYIIPSVLIGLAAHNLNIEKACKVNLGYPCTVCDQLSALNTTGLELENTMVTQLVAAMNTWKSAVQSILPTILILFMGAWSDRTGSRKLCMLLPIVGEFVTCISLIACTYWFYELPMEVAGVSEVLWPGLTGGWFTMSMGMFSYICDITSVESRTLRVGAATSFLTLGVPIGMALSGFLFVMFGFYGVYSIAAACYFISFAYGQVVIKDSVTPVEREKDEKLDGREKMSRCESLLDFFSPKHVMLTFRVAFKEGPKNRKMRVCVLMLIVIVLFGPMYGEIPVGYLSARYRFNWDVLSYSLFSTYSLVINLIGTMIALGIFSHWLKMDDALIGALSCISKILGCFLYAFARENWMMYLAPLIEAMSGTSFIAMRSITSKLVPPDELGKVNSIFGACEAIVLSVYGPIYGAVYGATVTYLPGAFYLVGGSLMVPGVVAFLWLYRENLKDMAELEQKTFAVENVKTFMEQNKLNANSITKIIIPEKGTGGLGNVAFEAELH